MLQFVLFCAFLTEGRFLHFIFFPRKMNFILFFSKQIHIVDLNIQEKVELNFFGKLNGYNLLNVVSQIFPCDLDNYFNFDTFLLKSILKH